jgi:hypothetical protein
MMIRLTCIRLAIFNLVLCFANQVAPGNELADFGFAGDREGIVELLGLLAGQADSEGSYNNIVEELDSEDFATREAATLKLSRMPIIDRAALKNLAGKVSPEVAIRIQRVLKANSLERFDSLLKAVLNAITKTKTRGVVELLFEALETRENYGKGEIWKKVGEAVIVTARHSDIDYLVSALESTSDVVRGGAVQAIVEVADSGAADLILTVADDPCAYVKWEVARNLALLRRRECLKPFAELLMCDDDFGMRWRSLDELRRITGERFNYYAAGNTVERKEPAAEWLAWIESNAATADLNFDHAGKDEVIEIFNGNDLEGWREFRGANLPKVVDRPEWQVEDGILQARGINKGELRSEKRLLNYSIGLEYRFPSGLGDSGVGIFAGDPGEGYLEVQLRPGNSGDLYRIGDLEIITDSGERLRFSAPKFKASNEIKGEWNKLQIRVIDGAVEVKVNGLLQNRARGGPKTPGGIVLREEGSRVEFRNIIVEKL